MKEDFTMAWGDYIKDQNKSLSSVSIGDYVVFMAVDSSPLDYNTYSPRFMGPVMKIHKAKRGFFSDTKGSIEIDDMIDGKRYMIVLDVRCGSENISAHCENDTGYFEVVDKVRMMECLNERKKQLEAAKQYKEQLEDIKRKEERKKLERQIQNSKIDDAEIIKLAESIRKIK